MMEKRLILGMCLIIGLLGCGSFFSLLLYFDPFTSPELALSLLIFSFLLWQVSWTSFLLYFIKKIYYRGQVYMLHVTRSIRQAFGIGSCIVGVLTVYALGMPLLITSLVIFALWISFELFLHSFYS